MIYSESYIDRDWRLMGALALISGLSIGFLMSAGRGGVGVAAFPLLLLLSAVLVQKKTLRLGSPVAFSLFFLGSMMVVAGFLLSSIVRADAELQRVISITGQYLFVLVLAPLILLNLDRSALGWLIVGLLVGGAGLAFIAILVYFFFQPIGFSYGWIWPNGRLYMWGNANELGTHMAVLTVLSLFGIRFVRKPCVFLVVPLISLFVTTVLLTGSNSSLLVLVAGVGVFLVASGRIVFAMYAAIAVLVLSLAILLLNGSVSESSAAAISRFEWIFDADIKAAGTFDVRFATIAEAWMYIQKNPIVGLGAGAAAFGGAFTWQPHNAFVLIWAEGGVFSFVGIVLWILALFVLVKKLPKSLRPYGWALLFMMILSMNARTHVYQLGMVAPILSVTIYGLWELPAARRMTVVKTRVGEVA